MLSSGTCARRALCRVGPSVGETRSQVQQRARRSRRDPRVTVGRAGRDTLEETEDRPHRGCVVEAGDKVHLGRTGVREARGDVVRVERREQGVGAVHGSGRSSSSR